MDSKITPSRDTTIDTVKFMLIFGIFIFHYGNNAGGWYGFFAQFHVPAFFMISGFWAMKKLDRSIWDYIKNAFNKYLVLWLLWVCIYPLTYMVTAGYGIKSVLLLLKKFFFAVRGSGIAGMWFVPAFFMVGLCYFLVAKALRKIPKLSESAQAWIHLGIALVVTVVFRRTAKTENSWLFSIDQVPIHWFYYALGRVVHIGFQWLKTKSKPLRYTVLAISTISIPYMVLMYFDPTHRVWGLIYNKLPLLPEAIGVMMALCGLFWIARFIRCGFFAHIGQATLGLCLCEIMAKFPIKWGFELLRWTVSNQWIAILCSFLALLIGCYIIIPPIDLGLKYARKQISRKNIN